VVLTGRLRSCGLRRSGLFSGAVLISGEDSEQYKQLLIELMEEYKPAGPTLRDEVVELANLMWNAAWTGTTDR
jgi:hypothetical protein